MKRKQNKVLCLLMEYKWSYLLVLGLVIADCIATYEYPKFLTQIIDIAIPNKDGKLLVEGILGLASFQAVSISVSLMLAYMFSRISNSFIVKVKKQIILSMFEIDGCMIDNKAKAFNTALTGDINNIELLASRVMADLFIQITTVAITGIVLVKINHKIIVFILLIYPVLIGIQILFNKKIEKCSSFIMCRTDTENCLIKEFVTYIHEYIVLGAKKYYLRRFMYNEEDVRRGYMKYNMLLSFNRFIPQIINTIVYLIIIAISGQMVMAGKIYVGQFTVILLYTQRMFNPIASIMSVFGQLEGAKVSMNRLNKSMGGGE